MEKLYAKHTKNEVPVINVVCGITLHVKLHQASFLFFIGDQHFMSRDHLTTLSRQKATLNKNEHGALTVQKFVVW